MSLRSHARQRSILQSSQDPKLNSGSCSNSRQSLLLWNDLPLWRRDNEYIISGYQPTTNSFKDSVHGIWAMHNETINIHSHLQGAVLFSCLLIYFFRHLDSWCPGVETADTTVFSMYFFGVSVCLLLSSIYHTLMNHSPGVATLGNQLHYLGIIFFMWGACIPQIYYGFWDNPGLCKFYWTTSTLLCLGSAAVTVNPRFRTPAFRTRRTILYTSLGLTAIVYVLHGIIVHGWEVQSQRMSLVWELLTAFLFILGGGLYALRIPEKWYPLRFDIFGASHQIFHLMVLLGGLAHTAGLVQACRHVHAS
ncbi:mPR-like GPCR protein [Xylariomycetidae sp. FL2044]|nr:mPR-like GPCR protein [Xylariomycetidae sp. FL2044]